MNRLPDAQSSANQIPISSENQTSQEGSEKTGADILELIEMPIAAISLGTAAVLVVTGIVLRYTFAYSNPAFDEITRYAVIWSAFIASSRLLRHQGHITIDVLLVRLPERWQVVMRSISFAAGALFCALLVWFGIKFVTQSYVIGAHSQSSLRVPMWIPQLVVPVGGGLLLVRFLQHLVSHIRQLPALFRETATDDTGGCN